MPNDFLQHCIRKYIEILYDSTGVGGKREKKTVDDNKTRVHR